MEDVKMLFGSAKDQLALFEKYQRYIFSRLIRLGVEQEDLLGEAWLIFDEAKRDVDIQKVQCAARWHLLPFLRNRISRKAYQCLRARRETPVEDISLFLRARTDTHILQPLMYKEFAAQAEKLLSPQAGRVLSYLSQGYSCKQIADKLQVTQQRVSALFKKLKEVVPPLLAQYRA